MARRRRNTQWAGPFFALGTLVLAVGALRFSAPLLVPIATAVLRAFRLTPVVRWLERRAVPAALASGMAVSAVIVVVGGPTWVVSCQVNALLDAFPSYEENLRRKLAVLKSEDGNMLGKLREIAREVDKEISGESHAGNHAGHRRSMGANHAHAPLAVRGQRFVRDRVRLGPLSHRHTLRRDVGVARHRVHCGRRSVVHRSGYRRVAGGHAGDARVLDQVVGGRLPSSLQPR